MVFFQLKSIEEIMDDLGLQIFMLKVLLNPSKDFLYPPESPKLQSDQTRRGFCVARRGEERRGVQRNVITYQLVAGSEWCILSGAGFCPQVCGLGSAYIGFLWLAGRFNLSMLNLL